MQAQDKYEFATIIWSPQVSRLYVSVNGKEFTEEKVELSKIENVLVNTNPLLNKLNEFQDKGWEVMTVIPIGGNQVSHCMYLRKKKS